MSCLLQSLALCALSCPQVVMCTATNRLQLLCRVFTTQRPPAVIGPPGADGQRRLQALYPHLVAGYDRDGRPVTSTRTRNFARTHKDTHKDTAAAAAAAAAACFVGRTQVRVECMGRIRTKLLYELTTEEQLMRYHVYQNEEAASRSKAPHEALPTDRTAAVCSQPRFAATRCHGELTVSASAMSGTASCRLPTVESGQGFHTVRSPPCWT